MKLKDSIKIECIKRGYKLTDIAISIGITRQNLYHHIVHRNKKIINQIENILGLEKNHFL